MNLPIGVCNRTTSRIPGSSRNVEERRYPIRKAGARETLQHLMEARGLRQKDLWKIFGSKGVASEVVRGKRAVSKAQAKKLAEFFHVGADLFI